MALRARWPEADVAVRYVDHNRDAESYFDIDDPDDLDNGELTTSPARS